jgi:hypothetical protein
LGNFKELGDAVPNSYGAILTRLSSRSQREVKLQERAVEEAMVRKVQTEQVRDNKVHSQCFWVPGYKCLIHCAIVESIDHLLLEYLAISRDINWLYNSYFRTRSLVMYKT